MLDPFLRNQARAAIPGLVMLASVLLPFAAEAQLYSWKDAQGNVTIKNAPPPWYSESERVRGPRVQVLRNGKLIDDTAWPQDKRQEGRNEAARLEQTRAKAEAEAKKAQAIEPGEIPADAIEEKSSPPLPAAASKPPSRKN